MNCISSGTTAAMELAIDGRSVVGLSPAEDLSVNSVVDLAIDERSDLAVFRGVVWAGKTAAQAIGIHGTGVEILDSPP